MCVRVRVHVHVCTHLCGLIQLSILSSDGKALSLWPSLGKRSGSDHAEGPCHVTHRTSQSTAQGKELSCVRAGAASVM